eukprot:scaffold26455_cov152-Cylindrotheca_fusiformis.AAC.1
MTEETDQQKDIQRGAPRKVWFGLIALVLVAIAVAAAVLLPSKGSGGSQPSDIESLATDPTSDPTSDPTANPTSDPTANPTSNPNPLDIDLLANVVIPGVNISDLNETAPQYRALEWLAYKDLSNMTIENNATELLERFSLVTLYYSTGGENWSGAQSWLKSSSHCWWNGNACNDAGRVSFIECPFYLHGTLPTEIGNLNRLTYMDLSASDELVGTIPSEIGNLNRLGTMIVNRNSISGTIPSEIGNMQNLYYASLEENELSGPIPSEIGHLQQLRSLDLSSNNLSGPIPSEIGNMGQLRSLDLSNNIGLTGTVPVF